MKIYVDQRAISRNASNEEQEPVFIIEAEDGTRSLAEGVTGPGWRLCYDKARQPRAWLEVTEEI